MTVCSITRVKGAIVFSEMGRLRFSRLRDLRQLVAGQDSEETCHSVIKALRAAAGKSSYRLGLEQHCPLPQDIERGEDNTMATA